MVAIYKKSSGKQTVTLTELQEVALCHGWVDNLGQRIDDERWALRFTPRRPEFELVCSSIARWPSGCWRRIACCPPVGLCLPPDLDA